MLLLLRPTSFVRLPINMTNIIKRSFDDISYEYIRGLIEGEGCFSFCTFGKEVMVSDGRTGKMKLPAFIISMHERDIELLRSVRNKLKLRNSVYHHKEYKRNDGYKHGRMSTLIVRDFGQLRNIIIPLFYKKLIGNKALQFENWVNLIDYDPFIPERYKILSMLLKSGFYDKNLKNFE